MKPQDITIDQWVILVAFAGSIGLAACTVAVLALDGLRWYQIRLKRMRRLDGPCD